MADSGSIDGVATSLEMTCPGGSGAGGYLRVGPLRRLALVAVAAVWVVAVAGCGSSGGSSAPPTTAPSASTAPETTTAVSTPATVTAHGVRGKRYCEVLLVTRLAPTATADVYNSYPLNACPAAEWTALDAGAIARQNGVPLAVLNGPRYWLMDGIAKDNAANRVTKTFGGIAMIREATVNLGSLADAVKPYASHSVDRATVFTFDAGSTVYELIAPGGVRWVMQTYSQQKDPTLSEADLPGLASRLHLPAGWSYRPRELTVPLRVVTTTTAAKVLQDDLADSYSLETSS